MAYCDRGDHPPEGISTIWEQENKVKDCVVVEVPSTKKQVQASPSLPRTCQAVLLLVAAFVMIILGTVLGKKASRVPIFWLVNVASDTFFAIAVAAAARASPWVYEVFLTKRINQGVRTPLYLTEGLGPLATFGKENRGMRCLAWLAAAIVFSQLLADTGLDAEQTFVSQESDGLIWVAGANCSPQTGIDIMPMGPYMNNGALGLGVIDENEFPLAFLAVNIYAGRVPDDAGRVERVTFAGDFIDGSERAYYSASLKPIIEIPRIIPVIKKEIQTYGS